MKRLLALICLSSLALAGCGTVSPDHVKGGRAGYDASTPPGYDTLNGGFVGYRKDARGVTVGVVTANKRTEFGNLVKDYAVQYRIYAKVDLHPGDGITPWTDPRLYAVDLERLHSYADLEQWKRDQRPADSLLQKLTPK